MNDQVNDTDSGGPLVYCSLNFNAVSSKIII